METHLYTRSWPRILFGAAVLIIGVIFLLDNLGVVYSWEYLRYWPILLILLGGVKMFEPTGTSSRVFWGVVALVGVLLLLDRLDVLEFRFWDLWPVILILLGFAVLRGSQYSRALRHGSDRMKERTEPDPYVRMSAVLGGTTVTNTSSDFRGGEVTAIMGGGKVDLRQSSIKSGEARLDVFTFWGGIEILVPRGWTVVVQASPIMGGIEDKTDHTQPATQGRLVITGSAIMGGVEIKN
jgi:predicted membrane protein